ncbi:MAG: hypothetical protein KJ667_09675 [Alphaproteobacteria bacterium]|nr:hypothetical protein [Alphaproteobacteria bacterium]
MKSGIGIGCFWFELETDKPHETFQNLNADDFVSKIKAALETVDNVSAVETIGKPRIIGFNRSSEDEEGNYLPIFSNLSIQFKLHLPFRVQKQYSNGYGRAEVTENFIVLIRYNADIPVTYIYQQDLQDGVNDTTSPVMFIREYLKDKLENSPHCKFSALGPSPFHADIFLDIQINSLAELIETNLVISSRGYDTIDINSRLIRPKPL